MHKFLHYTGLNETSFDSIYRADGTLAYKQLWTMRPSMWYGGEQPAVQRRMLIKVEVYSADGKTQVRDFNLSSGGWYVDHVVDYNPDGTKTVHDVLYDGTVMWSTKYDKDMKEIETRRYTPRDAFKITIERPMTENYMNSLDPRLEWQRLEDDPEAR